MKLSDFFRKRGAKLENGRIGSFSNVNDEFELLEDAVITPLLGNGHVRVTGNDRLDFVHGQVTNSVKDLAQNHFSENLLLNHKGHAIVDLNVFKRADDLYLAVEGGAEFTIERFRKHIIFDQVGLEDLSEKLVTFTVQGNKSKQLLEAALKIELPKAEKFIQLYFEDAKILLNSARRTKHGGYDIHLCSSDGARVFEKLLEFDIQASGEDALHISRVEALIPMAIYEAGTGVLPQEAGLEPKLSYNKGCYLGQEIIARIHARANLRRGLVLLKLDKIPTEINPNIILNNKKIGHLGTVVKHPRIGIVALAVLRNDVEEKEFTVAGIKAETTNTNLP